MPVTNYTYGDVGACNCSAPTTLPCSPCAIPLQNLVISWTDPLEGNGSDTLVWNGATSWATGCSGGAGLGNQFVFTLLCTGGQIELRVTYFTAGTCPTGTSNYCSNLRATPFGLTLSSATCGGGFALVFALNSTTCPAVSGAGFLSFVVTL